MNRIRELRLSHNMKQIDLARQLGISQGTLSSWENNKFEPDVTSLLALSKIFSVSIDFLLGNDDDLNSNNYLLGHENKIEKPAAIFEDERQAELNAIFERMPDEASKDKMIQLVRSFEITNKYEIGHRYIGGIAAKGGNKPIVHRIPPKKK